MIIRPVSDICDETHTGSSKKQPGTVAPGSPIACAQPGSGAGLGDCPAAGYERGRLDTSHII